LIPAPACASPKAASAAAAAKPSRGHRRKRVLCAHVWIFKKQAETLNLFDNKKNILLSTLF
jgi:hypothetical protein